LNFPHHDAPEDALPLPRPYWSRQQICSAHTPRTDSSQ